ncbi:MAG: hypothetical protein ACFFAI_11515 [Promethearchaeota archaeon]
MTTNDTLKDSLKFNFIRIVGTDFPCDHNIAALTAYSKIFWF